MTRSHHNVSASPKQPAAPSNTVKGLLIITLVILICLGAGICIGTVRSTNQQERVLKEQQLLAQVLVSRYEGIHTITFWDCGYSMNYGTTYWYTSNNYSTHLSLGGHPGDLDAYYIEHASGYIEILDTAARKQGWFAGDLSTGMRYRDTELDYQTTSLDGVALTVKPCFA